VITDISDRTFHDVIKQDGLVIVEFWAPWCTYCKQLEPILEQLDTIFEGKIMIAKLNVETDTEVSAELNVQSLPAMFIYKNGTLVGNVTGFVPKQTLEEGIRSLL